jgi:hypothetical protein
MKGLLFDCVVLLTGGMKVISCQNVPPTVLHMNN